MKRIITSVQMRDSDRHTLEHTTMTSLDLMEKASMAFLTLFTERYPDKQTSITVYCGTGNNGGDGLAVARLLQANGYDAVTVWIARFTDKSSKDFEANLVRLRHTPIAITELYPSDGLPDTCRCVIIDALFGSGLNRPLTGDWLRLVQHLNNSQNEIVAIDIPSGLRADGTISEYEYSVHADWVITFQRPKLSFFFPESSRAVKQFQAVDIGLDETFIESLPSTYRLVEANDIANIYRQREQFSHKGTFGHTLIVAGSPNTMGAAILASGACLYSGSGRTSVAIPPEGLTTLNTRYPEVMYCPWAQLADRWNSFDAVAIGPGLGDACSTLTVMLNYLAKPLVLDADALTYIGENPALLLRLPKGSILTPHMKEFDRLFGEHDNWWNRVQTARTQAATLGLIIVLKNRYAFIALPDGNILINPTGNPAMATGGMGDVLTGVLASFLAQGYPPQEAAILGCYVHGLAGDRLAAEGMAVVPAAKVVDELPYAMASINRNTPPFTTYSTK